jgi:hypothetical protein
MGADMLVNLVYHEDGKKLNWKAGHKEIDRLIKVWGDTLPDAFSWMEDPKDELHSMLTELQGAVESEHREICQLDFPPYLVYLTGGMSWGDNPSEIYQSFQTLAEEDSILAAVGLNPPMVNFQAILKKILKNKALLPLLTGIDKDLDVMLEKRLRK